MTVRRNRRYSIPFPAGATMPRRGEGRTTGKPVTTEIPLPAGGVKLVTFIPWALVTRGMQKDIITPIDAPEAAAERQRKKTEQLSPVVRALGLATYWQSLLDDGKFASLTEIARAEGIDRAYVSRVFKLTRVSPEIVEKALAGKVTMEALMAMGGCWVRQEVGQNITYSGMVHRRKPSLGSRMG
jgi:hypothetical protein